MKYKGKSVEIIGSKTLFGKDTVWIHILEDNTFVQVLRSDLEDDITDDKKIGMSYLRYVAIAARIKEEMAQKRLLAPYESSLIPLPHQILVLEKVMQGVQTRFLLADEVGMGKTIEAGLIIKEKKLRGELKRILLVVPMFPSRQCFNGNKSSKGISMKAFTYMTVNSFPVWLVHSQVLKPKKS